jgi:hypothetical protein
MLRTLSLLRIAFMSKEKIAGLRPCFKEAGVLFSQYNIKKATDRHNILSKDNQDDMRAVMPSGSLH